MAKPKEPKGEKEKVEAPAEDIPESESSEEEEVADQPQPEPEEQESPETETGENEEGEEVPKENAAWAAMRKENKRLKEALESTDPEYLKRLREATSPQQEYQVPETPRVDETTDYSQLADRVNWTQDQVNRTRQENAQLRNQLELIQDRQAEEAFPELKTDKVFQQIVSEKKLANRVLGSQRTTLEIAREVKNLLSKREEQVKVQSAEETKQQIAEKQAATAEARGKTTGGKSVMADEELRQRVRKGDQKATEEVAKGLIADLEF